MNDITLNQLSVFMWYAQQLLVKDEKDNVLFTGENWNQIKFDRWEYNGHPANDDGFRSDDNSINIYLSPDTKYTAEHRDLLISIKSPGHMIRDLQFI